MGFWSGYRATLKPLEVEEPIDVYVHRPLAYVLARGLYPLPISPNAVTALSIVAGLASAGTLLVPFAHHMQVAGLLLFVSAVLDCADGQLARMRKSSSVFGRMLDGSADFFTVGSVAPASVLVMCRTLATGLWTTVTLIALTLVMVVTTSFHTTMYDHYKNVFLKLTGPYQETDDYEAAVVRRDAARASGLSWPMRVCYAIYLFYLKSQRDYVLKFDPYTSARLTLFPPFTAERAQIYRARAGATMRTWRNWFGFGSLVFEIALALCLERPELLVAFRLIVLNAFFYLYLRPAQREASRSAFAEMGLALPDQITGERKPA
jgi:phosphatidylglycerophosphate synthase